MYSDLVTTLQTEWGRKLTKEFEGNAQRILEELHRFNAIDTKEEGNAKEEEMKKYWWSINSDNFTLMYGQEMDALVD